MYEVNFIKWKNISTKFVGTITIWIETNRQLFDILQDMHDKNMIFIIQYQWNEIKFNCSINTEKSGSLVWTYEQHWLCKLDITWGNFILIDMLQSGNLFINI